MSDSCLMCSAPRVRGSDWCDAHVPSHRPYNTTSLGRRLAMALTGDPFGDEPVALKDLRLTLIVAAATEEERAELFAALLDAARDGDATFDVELFNLLHVDGSDEDLAEDFTALLTRTFDGGAA